MIVDTHAHLYLEQFSKDIDEVISNCALEGVEKIYLPNIDSTTTEAMLALCKKHPDSCYPMIGLHPCSVKENFKEELKHITDMIEIEEFSGVGETGIDLYWDKTFKKQQINCFEFQIDLAKKKALPIIIHSRDSLELTIEIIESHQDGNLKGIFHCFNGTKSQCKKIADVNFLMGLGGVITYKKADMGEVVSYMPKDHFVLETDAPYLAPVPKRGKRNESAYIKFVAEKVAEFRRVPVEEVIEVTTTNALALFGKT